MKQMFVALKYNLEIKEKRNQSYFGLKKELKEEIIALKSQINALEEQKEDLEEKVIDLEEKIDLKANMDTMDMKKASFLDDIVKKYEAGTQEREQSSHLDKRKEIKDERFLAQKQRLLDKLKEVDNQKEQEQEAPVKKRNYGRER